MCTSCDYENMLDAAGLDPTVNRLRVLEVVGNNNFPLPAGDICRILQRTSTVNRVTVYRILDLLVAHGLIDRISTGGRANYFGMAPNENHRSHPHFYCILCGRMDCLDPDSITVDANPLEKTLPGSINKIEIRVDGICDRCSRCNTSALES